MEGMSDEVQKQLMGVAHEIAQDFLTDEDYFKYYKDAQDWAFDFIAKEGSLHITFIVYGRHKTDANDWTRLLMIMSDWPPPDHIGKDKAMQSIGVKFYDEYPDYMPVMVVQVAEAWAVYANGAEGVKPPTGSLANDPRRVEVVMTFGGSIDQRNSMSERKIIRDDSGKVTKLEGLRETLYDPQNPDSTKVIYSNLVTQFFLGYMKAKRHHERTV